MYVCMYTVCAKRSCLCTQGDGFGADFYCNYEAFASGLGEVCVYRCMYVCLFMDAGTERKCMHINIYMYVCVWRGTTLLFIYAGLWWGIGRGK